MSFFGDLVRSHGALCHSLLGGETGVYKRSDGSVVRETATGIIDFDVDVMSEDGVSVQNVITGSFLASEIEQAFKGDEFFCSSGNFFVRRKLTTDGVSIVVILQKLPS
ncbi:hypothetical protein TDB9533_01235 [Thalassocella blandensis]|nr:hypothetical protein TDB9533_01235 [Thalassocella blandensis]